MIVKKKRLVVETTYATANGQPTVRERIEDQPVFYFFKAVAWIVFFAFSMMAVRGREDGLFGMPFWTNYAAPLIVFLFCYTDLRSLLKSKVETVEEIDQKNREIAAEFVQ